MLIEMSFINPANGNKYVTSAIHNLFFNELERSVRVRVFMVSTIQKCHWKDSSSHALVEHIRDVFEETKTQYKSNGMRKYGWWKRVLIMQTTIGTRFIVVDDNGDSLLTLFFSRHAHKIEVKIQKQPRMAISKCKRKQYLCNVHSTITFLALLWKIKRGSYFI